MQARTYIVTAALLLAGAAPASAQSQWPSYQYPPPPATYYVPYMYPYLPSTTVYPSVPTTPPSWSFDPYTSGLGPCPQRGPGDEPCSERISPSYGQPNYWPR